MQSGVFETKIYLFLLLRSYLLLPQSAQFEPEQLLIVWSRGSWERYIIRVSPAIRFSPAIFLSPAKAAIRFYELTFGVIISDIKTLVHDIWILEQAADASFYELTLPKQINELGVGSVKLQSSLYSLHI